MIASSDESYADDNSGGNAAFADDVGDAAGVAATADTVLQGLGSSLANRLSIGGGGSSAAAAPLPDGTGQDYVTLGHAPTVSAADLDGMMAALVEGDGIAPNVVAEHRDHQRPPHVAALLGDRLLDRAWHELKPHQREATGWMLDKLNACRTNSTARHSGIILADSPGMGKTRAALYATMKLQRMGEARHICVVVPAQLLGSWAGEFAKAGFPAPLTLADPLWRLQWERPTPSALLVSYEGLVAHEAFILANLRAGYDLMVVDEAHKLVNKTSQRYQSVKACPCPVVLVTGTPLLADPDQHTSILELVVNGPVAQSDVANRLQELCMQRSFTAITGDTMPPPQLIVDVSVDLPAEELAKYRDLREQRPKKKKSAARAAFAALADHERIVVAAKWEVASKLVHFELGRLRHVLVASPALAPLDFACTELAKTVAESQLFWVRGGVDPTIAADALGTPPSATRPPVVVFVSVTSMTGLNLMGATSLVVIQEYGQDVTSQQLHARIRRIGQQRCTTVWRLTVAETEDAKRHARAAANAELQAEADDLVARSRGPRMPAAAAAAEPESVADALRRLVAHDAVLARGWQGGFTVGNDAAAMADDDATDVEIGTLVASTWAGIDDTKEKLDEEAMARARAEAARAGRARDAATLARAAAAAAAAAAEPYIRGGGSSLASAEGDEGAGGWSSSPPLARHRTS